MRSAKYTLSRCSLAAVTLRRVFVLCLFEAMENFENSMMEINRYDVHYENTTERTPEFTSTGWFCSRLLLGCAGAQLQEAPRCAGHNTA